MKEIMIWSAGLIAAAVCGIYVVAVNAPVYLIGAVFFLDLTLLFGTIEAICVNTRLGLWIEDFIDRMWGR